MAMRCRGGHPQEQRRRQGRADMQIRSQVTQTVRRLWVRLPAILAAIVVLGLFVRLTIRDRWPLIALFFYMTPLLLLAVFSASCALIWFRRRQRRPAAFAVVVSVACTTWWHATCHFTHNPPSGPTGTTVVFWNTARGIAGWTNLAKELAAADADLIGLVEAGPSNEEMRRFWRDSLPLHQVVGPKHGMVVLAKGSVVEQTSGRLGNSGTYGHYSVHLRDRALEVIVVDIGSNPLLSRQEEFAHLVRILDDLSERPVIVMGDFNTPMDSAFVELLSARARNAFQTCGYGYDATWPIPLPMLSLDQVWTNARVSPRNCELPWTWRSDHRPIRVTLEPENR